MTLTQISTAGVKDNAVTSGKIPADAIGNSELAPNAVSGTEMQNNSISTGHIVDEAVTLAKLPQGTSSNDGKFLRANNGADPTFEVVNTPPFPYIEKSGLWFESTRSILGSVPETVRTSATSVLLVVTLSL